VLSCATLRKNLIDLEIQNSNPGIFKSGSKGGCFSRSLTLLDPPIQLRSLTFAIVGGGYSNVDVWSVTRIFNVPSNVYEPVENSVDCSTLHPRARGRWEIPDDASPNFASDEVGRFFKFKEVKKYLHRIPRTLSASHHGACMRFFGKGIPGTSASGRSKTVATKLFLAPIWYTPSSIEADGDDERVLV